MQLVSTRPPLLTLLGEEQNEYFIDARFVVLLSFFSKCQSSLSRPAGFSGLIDRAHLALKKIWSGEKPWWAKWVVVYSSWRIFLFINHRMCKSKLKTRHFHTCLWRHLHVRFTKVGSRNEVQRNEGSQFSDRKRHSTMNQVNLALCPPVS